MRWAGRLVCGAIVVAALLPVLGNAAVAVHFSPVTADGAPGSTAFADAACPSTTRCDVVGSAGTTGIVTLTTDAGASWHTLTLPGSGPLAAIGCASPADCVAATSTGTVVITRDGWTTTTRAALPSGASVVSVACPSVADCLAGGGSGPGQPQLYASTDGGAAWQTLSAPGATAAVRCLDVSHCWVAGGGAWLTTDLGATFTSIEPPVCGSPGSCTGPAAFSLLQDVEFTSPSDGYVVGGDQCGGQGVTQCPGALFHTTDGGATWQLWPGARQLPTGWQVKCRAGSCIYDTEAFQTSTVLTGAGQSWSTVMTVPGALNALACTPDGGVCVLAGATDSTSTPSPLLYSTASLGVPAATGGTGGNGGASQGTGTAPPLESTIASTAATPAAVVASPSNALVDALVVVLLVLFVTFPAHLFNRTWEANQEPIRAWWTRRLHVRPPSSNAGKRRNIAAFAGVIAGAAALGALLDPRAALDGRSLLTAAAIVIALLVGVAVAALTSAAFRRTLGVPTTWRLHAVPGALLVGAVCVLVSRMLQFQPGYLYGVIGGVAFAATVDRRRQGQESAIGASATLLAAVAAWLVWGALPSGGSVPLVLVRDVLAAVFVSGLVGLVIGLVPLRFLPGERIAAWSRPAWSALYAVSAFALLEIMLRPQSTTAHVDGAPFWTTVGLFVGFGACSVGFWAYWRVRARAVSAPRPRHPAAS